MYTLCVPVEVQILGGEKLNKMETFHTSQPLLFQMSSFKFTITLESEFNTQELADFFAALAQSERGNVQPLFRILHPVSPPPTPPTTTDSTPPAAATAPTPVATPTSAAPSEPVPPPVPVPAPAARNILWERSNITLVNEEQVDRLSHQILSGEVLSSAPSISWTGPKHSPRAQHNQRILNALRQAANRTLSYQMIAAQAGIPEADKLKSYLRELEKQGFVSVARVR